MGFGLYQEQTQKLIMTMQMKQAIEVLQCSALELNEYVTAFVEGNPCADCEPAAAHLMESWAKRALLGNGIPTGSRDTRTAPPLEQVVQVEMGLQDALESQIGLQQMPDHVRRIALFLIGCLDERGYLTETDETFAQLLKISIADVQAAIRVLQSCEPSGIAARDIKECLRLQIDAVPLSIRPIVAALIDNHLEDIAAGRVTAIARALHVTVQAVQELIDELRKLNPKPGLAYTTASPQYVLPDVIVERVGSQFVVMTNEGAVPSIRFNRSYVKLLNNPDAEASQYLAKKLQAAEWLARCLEQRRMTLYRVAEAIVLRQQGFFHYGPSSMVPLTLRQIAAELGMHESTISRATRGKYMQTPRGVFEMKFFFSSELQSSSGVTSAEAAKHEIRKCIQEEDDERPYSDDAIAKMLSDKGISISRRTVAKYREELNIPSSAKRRRYR